MDRKPHRNIERSGPEFYSVRWSLEGDKSHQMLVHCEQVNAYFHFDAALRRGKDCSPHVPCGYPQFRDAYTHEATTSS